MSPEASRPAASGVLLVDKPRGMTSHSVVSRVRRAYGQREVGHTGTLDPLATGLMILTLGRAGRISRFIEATEKRYTGTVTLGRATTTYDAEGTTTAEAPVGEISREMIDRAFESLSGRIEQAVPAFSAVKVDGTRLYSRARRGEEVETPVREVEIHELRLVSVALPELVIDARVSKGTYIRSLAVQIGEALGLPAHLSALRRTKVGRFEVGEAKALDAIDGTELIPPAVALDHLPRIQLDLAHTEDVRHGRALPRSVVPSGWSLAAGDPVCLLDPAGSLIAVGLARDDARAFGYACVLS